MRLLIERVLQARVLIGGRTCGSIDRGLLVYVAYQPGDCTQGAVQVAHRLSHLRVFPDQAGRLQHSLLDVKGAILLVPAFTLLADCQGGHRPSLSAVAGPADAESCFAALLTACRATGLDVAHGTFGAAMVVEAANDGPVTCLLNVPPGSATIAGKG